jgi:hypothetical protein
VRVNSVNVRVVEQWNVKTVAYLKGKFKETNQKLQKRDKI